MHFPELEKKNFFCITLSEHDENNNEIALFYEFFCFLIELDWEMCFKNVKPEGEIDQSITDWIFIGIFR